MMCKSWYYHRTAFGTCDWRRSVEKPLRLLVLFSEPSSFSICSISCQHRTDRFIFSGSFVCVSFATAVVSNEMNELLGPLDDPLFSQSILSFYFLRFFLNQFSSFCDGRHALRACSNYSLPRQNKICPCELSSSNVIRVSRFVFSFGVKQVEALADGIPACRVYVAHASQSKN